MKVTFDKFPFDLVLCLIWSAILVPLVFFNVESLVRLILGVPFMLFIPGYVLVFVLFPFKRPGEGVTVIERIGLSLGVSVAIVPLFGLGLNFSSWGIRLEPLLLVLCLFIFGIGSVALYRWYATTPEERFSLTFNVRLPAFENRFDKVVTIILGALIIIAVSLTVYVIVIPKVGEKFTEFYVLGPNGKAEEYPQNLSIGQNATVLLGISNHEYREVTYSIDVWLINQSTYYNPSENKSVTSINHMWFMNEITVKLPHVPVTIENSSWEPQWGYNYSFSLLQKGTFKLEFLLFTTHTTDFTLNKDYKSNADQILSSAYRDVHLWVTAT